MKGQRASSGREDGESRGTRPPQVEPAVAEAPRLLRSKLRPPRPRLQLVERRAAVSRLLRSTEPLVLVSGPAGAGKSLLLLQWTEADERPAVWLQVDDADNDPVVLLTYLLTGLGQVADVDPEALGLLRLRFPPVRERVMPMLADALADAPPFLLVMDEAHALSNESCWEEVALLLEMLPEGAQLALGTRADPPLPLARLRADGSLLEVRNDVLALDRDETAELLRRYGDAADEDLVDVLLTATEGWATGAYLGALAMRGKTRDEWLAHLRGDQREIAAYLASEVFDRQPAELREFLVETAVAERLSPALCHAITGRDGAGQMLSQLARANLFVLPLDDRNEWFRYHHLVAELLRAELKRERPDDVPLLHERAAEWFLRQGEIDSTVHHLLAAHQVDRAADLVAAEWTRFWERGQIETVRRWLESFDERDVLDRPRLVMTAGWVFSALGQSRNALRWTHAACAAAVDDLPSMDGSASLRSSQAMLRANVAPDGVAAMRTDAELAFKLEARRGTSWHVDASLALGVARWLNGSEQQALKPLAAAMREGSVFNQTAELAALGYLSLLAADNDEWEVAREYERRARQRHGELGFSSSRRALPMLLARARLMAHEQDCGLDDLTGRIDGVLARITPHVWLRILGEAILGEVALSCGDLPEADSRRTKAQRLLDQYPDAGVLRKRVEQLRTSLERLRLTEPLTAAETRILELLPTHLTEAQIAEHLYVTRNTVKTHLRGLYRKLDVSSRAEAVERARELGLLRT